MIDLIELPEHYLGSYLLLFIAIFFILFFLQSRYDIIHKIIRLTKYLSLSRLCLIVFFLSSFLILSFFANSILQRFPNSADEYDYIFQAETFLKGRLWNEPPPTAGSFWITHTINKDGKWLSKYPPGWPLLLSIAMFFHIPAWLLNPIIGTTSLGLLFFLAQLFYNKEVGLLSAITVLCSPFFIFNTSSHFSHASCGLLILLAVYYFNSFCKNQNSSLDACLIGVCYGGAFLIRPYTTLVCFVPILIALLIKRKKEFFQKDMWCLMSGIIPFLLINLLYNYFITGNCLLSPFHWYDPQDTAQFKLSLVLTNIENLGNQVLWMNPAVFILYFLMIVSQSKKEGQAGGWIFLLLIITSFFYTDPRNNSYGYRYSYEGYLLCVLTVIGGLAHFKSGLGKKLLMLGLTAGFITNLLIIPVFASNYWHQIYYRNELYRLVEEKHLSNAIVLIPPQGTPMTPEDMTRNDPAMQNKVLYAVNYDEKNIVFLKYFPSRQYYRYIPWDKNEEQRLQKYKNPQ